MTPQGNPGNCALGPIVKLDIATDFSEKKYAVIAIGTANVNCGTI